MIGLIYVAFPSLSVTVLARLHFWLHNIGLPVLVLAIAGKKYGLPDIGVLIIIGWVLLAAGVVLFMVNMWDRLR